jgi:signal transduction histidine kinase
LKIAQKSNNNYAIAHAMYRLGWVHLYLTKDESKALEWTNKGIGFAKPLKDYLHLAKYLGSQTIIAQHQGIGNAEELGKLSVSYAKQSNDWQTIVTSYGILGNVYVASKNYIMAEETTAKLMDLVKERDKSHWLTLGIEYLKLLKRNNKPKQANAFRRELAAAKGKMENTQGDWIYLNDMANVEIALENYTEAERLLMLGIDKEKEKAKADTLHLYFFYRSLNDLFLAKQDYKKAYEWGMAYVEISQWLKEKRQTKDSQVKMTQLKARLDLEKKETEIALLGEQKKEQQLLLIAATMIGVMLIGFVVVLQRNRRRIERQKTELTALNTTKNKLFAILSHDLRSPIKSLRGHFMLMDWGALSQAEFATATQHLKTQLGNVNDMLENVLDWSVSQMGGMKSLRESIEIESIVAKQIQLLMPVANAKEIRLKYQVPVEARMLVDKNHLEIIVRNLLQNSIKFTHSGGEVSLNYIEKDGMGYVEVKDSGVGMSKAQLSNLFELKQEPSHVGTAQEQGTGLGLVMVKELVAANKGTIEVTSEVNQGATFLIGFTK